MSKTLVPAKVGLIVLGGLAVVFLAWYALSHASSGGLVEDRVTLPEGVHVGAPATPPPGASRPR